MTNPSMNSTVAEQLNLKSENSQPFDYSPSNTPVKLLSEIKNDSFLSKQAKIKDDIQKRIKEYMKI
jgi:hypothetical protein